jgi:hypothetical protein
MGYLSYKKGLVMKKFLLYGVLISLYVLSLQAQIVVPGYPSQPSYPQTAPINITVPTSLAEVLTALNDIEKNGLATLTEIRALDAIKARPGSNITDIRKNQFQLLQDFKNSVQEAEHYSSYATKIQSKSTLDNQNRKSIQDIIDSIKKDYAEAQMLVR